jgi:hypothetical protein
MFNFNDKTTPAQLMDELERFIVYWLGRRRDHYGEPVQSLSELRLPEPLRRLFGFAGRWPSVTGRDEMCEKYGWVSIFSTQDMLLRPSRLQWTDGRVVFIVENQGVWSLATETAGEDASVWIDADDVGPEECEKWPKVNDSLARLLITFCLQELTFGAKFGVWDTKLTELFRSGQPNVTPLWLHGTYVRPECNYNFYLMDDDVLVGDFSGSGTEDTCFFGANCERGIARIQANESPIVSVRLSTPTNWTVEIRADGSGEIGVFMKLESQAVFPPGTFDFVDLRDNLLASHKETGDYRTMPLVFFMRSGRGYAQGKGLPDWDLAKRILNKAIAAGMNKKPLFDVCCREVPFGEAD